MSISHELYRLLNYNHQKNNLIKPFSFPENSSNLIMPEKLNKFAPKLVLFFKVTKLHTKICCPKMHTPLETHVQPLYFLGQ